MKATPMDGRCLLETLPMPQTAKPGMSATRRWCRLHVSTCLVLLVVGTLLLVVNIPGDVAQDVGGFEYDFNHGWPCTYLVRVYRWSLPGDEKFSLWTVTDHIKEFRPYGVVLNVAVGLAMLAVVALMVERHVRRHGRLMRFSLRSLLLVTTLLGFGLAPVAQDLNRCRQEQNVIRQLRSISRGCVIGKVPRKYDWLRVLAGTEYMGTTVRLFIAGDGVRDENSPDLAVFSDLEGIFFTDTSLTGANLAALDGLTKLRGVEIENNGQRSFHSTAHSFTDQLDVPFSPIWPPY